jgi:2-alkyl-3-oxoalkanoate reductase
MRVGVVGASGFVGNRAVELLHADKNFEVRQIIHSSSSIQRLTLDHLDVQIANSFDESSLKAAFQGCDAIVHSVLGSSGLIRGCIVPTYRAAQKAGVRRIIYLSSMIVHGCAPAPGTTEETPPLEHQPFPTHSAKIYAERKLLELRKSGTVEVVIIRPGIVFGPRSRWVTELAHQLAQGTACFINKGKGICNTVYIDNLIHGMLLAMTSPSADGEAFFVSDHEQVTWFDFYRPFAEALGIDPTQIPDVAIPEFKHGWKQQAMDTVWNSAQIQKVLSFFPDNLKQNFKQNIKHLIRHPTLQATEHPQNDVTQMQPNISEMMSILQQSTYKLPFTKAAQMLGYEPVVSFSEGCSRSVQWLCDREGFSKQTNLIASRQP